MVLDIVAIVTPAKGKEARVEELLNQLVKSVHDNEPDVQRYTPYKTTNAEGDVQFVFIEKYPSEAALEAHQKTEVFGRLGKTFQEEGLLAGGLNIMKLEPLKEGFESR